MASGDETQAILEAIGQLIGAGDGGGSRHTQDLLYWVNTGSSLQSFIAPFDMNIRKMVTASTTRGIVSTNGRTGFDSNAISGSGGGLIGVVPKSSIPWEGNYPVRAGEQVWINLPIGNELSFTVERL